MKTGPGRQTAAGLIPPHPTLESLRAAAARCQACPLWRRATQTVFGEGPHPASLMLVGEQPGDAEDRQGRPFVGPAGRLLAIALGRAGIDRRDVYVTNAVKHFKWIASGAGGLRPPKPSAGGVGNPLRGPMAVERGKRRIHQKPNALEVAACRPWLLAEVSAVAPRVLVLMGVTAAGAVLGPKVRIGRDRGREIPSPLGPLVVVTSHPSSILRAPDEARRHEEMERFVADLVHCASLLLGPHLQPTA